MKIKLKDTTQIILIPENIQDKVWLATFMKEIDKEDEIGNMELTFDYGTSRGTADPKIVGVYNERIGDIEIEYQDINGLEINCYNL
jgi:hypothetical protein